MDFTKLTAYLDDLDRLHVPASDTLVYVNHQPVYRHFRGFSDFEKTIPMNGRETYFYFSATKMYTCTAALQLIEQGKLGLDDPVSRYIPSFTLLTVAEGDMTRAARRPMTIRHLMSMTGGLDYDLEARAIQNTLEMYGKKATTQQIASAIGHKPLQFDPGDDWKYSLGHDVLGAVIEIVSGMTLGSYMQKYLFEPLGIRRMSFRMNDDLKQHLCAQYIWDDQKQDAVPMEATNRYALSDCYESGGAGLMGDVESYIPLLDALACGGMGATGERILRPETVELYKTPQLSGKAYDTYFNERKLGYSYALGVRTMVDPAFRNARCPVGEFGWDGAAGAYALVDTEHQLSLFHAQHVRSYGFCYTQEHPVIRDLVYEGLGL